MLDIRSLYIYKYGQLVSKSKNNSLVTKGDNIITPSNTGADTGILYFKMALNTDFITSSLNPLHLHP